MTNTENPATTTALDALTWLAETQRAHRIELDQLMTDEVARARAAGVTWQAIGQALEMTKQGAQQRYGG